MSPNDIILWPDDYWCFREELGHEFARGMDYQVILHKCPKWQEMYEQGVFSAPSFIRSRPDQTTEGQASGGERSPSQSPSQQTDRRHH